MSNRQPLISFGPPNKRHDLTEGTQALQSFYFGSQNNVLEAPTNPYKLLANAHHPLLDIDLRHDPPSNPVLPLLTSQLHAADCCIRGIACIVQKTIRSPTEIMSHVTHLLLATGAD
ncbi:hypothetical protein PtA15_10A266 [Puccinia triticina]|uniref:Uncharacterized protein n=1 Tax=Puccinia triticina TaxID=208348 RepID=A0ABY7CUC4_9BASI|nr:uncharacterized protein PtA15_10A266 [Puccinia triticina]WAQ88846.1 hypothetical protein PtA15_10A266 [Puccinia triticina]